MCSWSFLLERWLKCESIVMLNEVKHLGASLCNSMSEMFRFAQHDNVATAQAQVFYPASTTRAARSTVASSHGLPTS